MKNTKAFSLVSIIFILFTICIASSIIYIIATETLKLNKRESIKDITQRIVKNDAQAIALDTVKKILPSKTKEISKEDGWHKIILQPSEWNFSSTYLNVMYYPEKDKEQIEVFVITYPKRNIDLIPIGSKNDLVILGLTKIDNPYPANKKNSFSVGQKLISRFGTIHTITDISEDDQYDYITLEPQLSQGEIEKNFLLIPRTDASIERFVYENK